jgi:transcriptional regulator with XRE-family HTH domain
MARMGRLVADLRKGRQMTQKDLAEKLSVSDKAVSKWERGLSCPDIALLSPLAGIFEISVGELLDGRINDAGEPKPDAEANLIKYAEKSVKDVVRTVRIILTLWVSLFLVISATVCSVVDSIINGESTWSPIIISVCVFVWLLVMPPILRGLKGVTISFIIFTAGIVPLLLVISLFNDAGGYLLPIGIRVAGVVVVQAWYIKLLTGIFLKRFHTRMYIAMAIIMVTNFPFNYVINQIFVRQINVAVFPNLGWDLYLIQVAVAAGFVVLDFIFQKIVIPRRKKLG